MFIAKGGEVIKNIEVVVFQFSLFDNDTVIINGSDVRELFVLVDAGVIHGSSKKNVENNLNPFWKYPANQADAVFAFGICVIIGFVVPCKVSRSKLFC